ncbi:MAG: hypothetical protein AAGI10_00440 [Pseudomonadota bacterium]
MEEILGPVQSLAESIPLPSDPDLWFVLGLVLVILMIPALFSAYVDGRVPRAPAVTLLIAVGMISYAGFNKPEGYEIGDIPSIFRETVQRYAP